MRGNLARLLWGRVELGGSMVTEPERSSEPFVYSLRALTAGSVSIVLNWDGMAGRAWSRYAILGTAC